MNELLGLPYSPWSEKARWALDVRRVPYRFRFYQPLLGEPALRFKLRRFAGTVSVPVLTTDDGTVLSDSADIARWSDGHGTGPRLFPPEHDAAVTSFVALSERGLAAGRSLALQRMLKDEEALSEMVPRGIRSRFPSAGIGLARFGVGRTVRKYPTGGSGDGAQKSVLTGVLDELRARLAKAPAPKEGEPQTLFGALTFADIAMAQVLINVEPPSSGLKMGAGSRRCFAEPGLRDEYADLVSWRDALYRVYRAPSAE